MKSLLFLLLLTSATLHAQTRDTAIQWRYDSMRNTQYGFTVDSVRYIIPAKDSFLYIGKDVANSDSVYRAQLWSRAVELKKYINPAKK